MNVYVVELSRRLAERGVEIEIFTRAGTSNLAPAEELAPGVTVRNLPAGPYGLADQDDLAGELCAFTSGVLRAEAARRPGWYDLVHSHYWLSGQAGRLVAARWGVPLVHSMHTMAKVKNAYLAGADRREPPVREEGEQRVVAAADRLVANTDDEAGALRALYGADPARVEVVHPGVDLDLFSPGDPVVARGRLGLRPGDAVVLYAGRVQPLKAPDVLLRAAAHLVAADPELRGRLVVAVVGGPSGRSAGGRYDLRRLARRLGIDGVVRFEPPQPQRRLADWYRAADLTVVPSRSESFGLVALESQASGTPVVAASVGGLRTAVADGRSGVLIDGHEPERWAGAIRGLLDNPRRRHMLARAAVVHAAGFGWDATAARMLDVYRAVTAERRADVPAQAIVA